MFDTPMHFLCKHMLIGAMAIAPYIPNYNQRVLGNVRFVCALESDMYSTAGAVECVKNMTINTISLFI